MGGFDEGLRYTVAASYDIDRDSITPVDASYGAMLGHEWFHVLPEITDPRDRGGGDYGGEEDCQQCSMSLQRIDDYRKRLVVPEDPYVATLSSTFSVKNLPSFLNQAAVVNMRLHFESPQETILPGEIHADVPQGYFLVTPHDGAEGEVCMGGYCGLPTGNDWKEAIRQHITPGQRMRISCVALDNANFNYVCAAAYDIDSESIVPVDATFGAVIGPGFFFNMLPEVHDSRNGSG
ncbi:MAG: hypothetical protein HY675_22400 [Chloroflexi bacterium]|nr:hypothetical protein [Chloroflexota bacterium]